MIILAQANFSIQYPIVILVRNSTGLSQLEHPSVMLIATCMRAPMVLKV